MAPAFGEAVANMIRGDPPTKTRGVLLARPEPDYWSASSTSSVARTAAAHWI